MERTPPTSPKKTYSNDDQIQESYVTNRPHKRQAPSTSPQSEAFSLPVTQKDVREIVTDIVQTQMNFFLAQVGVTISKSINRELSSLKEEIESVKNSMDFINEKFEVANSALQNTVNLLTNKINVLEQNARMNNIEVQCVAENKNENLNTIIMQIAKTGCCLTEENVLTCTRVAKNEKSNPRPRAIIAQLSSPRLRDNLLAAAITFNKQNKTNKLNSGHIGMAGERKPIYIMEHLSPANKSLHAAARIKGKELGYKYVWIRNGRIFMRKTDDSAYIIIRDKDFLDKLK
ncbi:hypothetical protein ABMA27_010292 [Loxostege sticticalis]|uniref:FP protein C-terminal domain-containing protein n=1 Tax=Loxostege sticticalis TaxID=481309 RepID=A0ABR3H595_LOXSC